MSKKVDVDLYEFMQNNECHAQLCEGKLEAWVCVNFYNLDDFKEVVGLCYFDDGGADVKMFDGYVSIDLIDICENHFGEEISNYKKCFEESEHKFFKEVTK